MSLSIKKVLGKGVTAAVVYSAPLLVATYLKLNPAVASLTLGTAVMMGLNWVKNRAWFDSSKTWAKAGQMVAFYGLPAIAAGFFEANPEVAQLSVGTALVMGANALKHLKPQID